MTGGRLKQRALGRARQGWAGAAARMTLSCAGCLTCALSRVDSRRSGSSITSKLPSRARPRQTERKTQGGGAAARPWGTQGWSGRGSAAAACGWTVDRKGRAASGRTWRFSVKRRRREIAGSTSKKSQGKHLPCAAPPPASTPASPGNKNASEWGLETDDMLQRVSGKHERLFSSNVSRYLSSTLSQTTTEATLVTRREERKITRKRSKKNLRSKGTCCRR
jgi:hypothetical protein